MVACGVSCQTHHIVTARIPPWVPAISSPVGWSQPLSNVLLIRHQHLIEETSRSVTRDISLSHVRQLLLYHHVLPMQNIYHIIILQVKLSY